MDAFSRALAGALELVRERELARALARLDEAMSEADRVDHGGRIELVAEINRALAAARRQREVIRAQVAELSAHEPEAVRERLDQAFVRVMDEAIRGLRTRKRQLSRPNERQPTQGS